VTILLLKLYYQDASLSADFGIFLGGKMQRTLHVACKVLRSVNYFVVKVRFISATCPTMRKMFVAIGYRSEVVIPSDFRQEK